MLSMNKDKREQKLTEVRLKIADVIINLNLIEKEIKQIISYYISSQQSVFVFDILLNNHIISLSNKIKVLQYIIQTEKLETSKDLYKALTITMNKRNVLAHSDSVLEDFEIDDVHIESDGHSFSYYPKYKESDPGAWIFSQGDINFETVEKIVTDFDKYYVIAAKELSHISQTLRIRYYIE